MGRTEKSRLDSRARLVVPQAFREMLGLKEGDEVFITLDEENERLIVQPRTAEELVVIEIVMGDEPGTLARLAKTLSDLGVDLVSSESRSTSRGKAAAWRVVCNASSVRDKNELKRRLEKSGAKTVRFQKA